jgi:CRP-like cAMP-binding protein
LEDFQAYNTKLQERIKLEVFQQCRLFRHLSADDLRELAGQATPVRYRKGSSIFEEGDAAEFFYVIQEGLVKVFKSTSSGKHLTFNVAGRSGTLNATAVSVGNYFMSAQPLNDVTVLKVPRKAYLAFLSKHPSVAIELIALLSSRLNRECDRVVRLLGEDVEQRLSITLLTLARKFGTNLSLTREELASCAGTTTETAIRVLSKLKKRGIIGCNSRRGGIQIADLVKLQDSVVEDEGWM